jgi:hypothetical protein
MAHHSAVQTISNLSLAMSEIGVRYVDESDVWSTWSYGSLFLFRTLIKQGLLSRADHLGWWLSRRSGW